MNWYDWYNVQRNKERLESSYSREQYSITLDSSLTSEIKKYNRDELAKGGYFDWKTIENGQSSFIDKYFDKKRDNIVGDNYILTILMSISTIIMGIFTSYLVYKTIKSVKRSKKKKKKNRRD